MVTAATRRDARERAVELLYEAHTKGVDVDDIVGALPLTPDSYALELARGVLDHLLEIDDVLARHARGWSVDRMAVTDRTVLRIGVFELAVMADVPTGAALSEAVELGGRYGSTDDTSRFVNGILAAVADEVRGARPWMPIDAVVLDMDGVIRHWDEQQIHESEARLGLPTGSITTAAFADPGFGDVTVGKITAEEWADQIGRIVSSDPDVSVGADEIAAEWLQSNWTVDREVVALADELRRAGTTVALFSNASSRLEADIETMGLTGTFDLVANSSRIGLAKPDVAGFEQVASMIGCDPGRLLFVDDRPENVVGALEAGWHAIEMCPVARLGDVFRRLAIPGAPGAA